MVGTISALPGQGIAYPLGAMQFEQLRALAEKELGTRFDVREFHRVMLEDGRLPFDGLRSKLKRWIHAKQATARTALNHDLEKRKSV